MAEIKLFELKPTVHERTSSEVVLEKELQNTIEQNMELFFGVRFLKSEYVITNVRMDSIELEDGFTRDMRNTGHYGTGDLEISIKTEKDFEKAKPLIERAYNEA